MRITQLAKYGPTAAQDYRRQAGRSRDFRGSRDFKRGVDTHSVREGPNVLIMHMTIDAGASSPLHASPSEVGEIARNAAVGRLILAGAGYAASTARSRSSGRPEPTRCSL